MRPPQNAGESGTHRSQTRTRADAASMRPPQNAGESEDLRRIRRDMLEASMRPPQNAGESCRLALAWSRPLPRFNEAPAERGGK